MNDDAIEDYFKRSGDTEMPDGELVENDHGFCIWRTYQDSLVLVSVYGDGKYWNDWADIKAKELGFKKIMFATKRNPEGFMKKFKFKVIGSLLERSIS